MLDRCAAGGATLGADRGYDMRNFVAGLRARGVTPHVAQNESRRRSAVDGRTTRHAGYAHSQRRRKLVEQVYGWVKTVGGGHKLRFVGLERNRCWLELTAAASRRSPTLVCVEQPFCERRRFEGCGRRARRRRVWIRSHGWTTNGSGCASTACARWRASSRATPSLTPTATPIIRATARSQRRRRAAAVPPRSRPRRGTHRVDTPSRDA